jgi:hypothetical protein
VIDRSGGYYQVCGAWGGRGVWLGGIARSGDSCSGMLTQFFQTRVCRGASSKHTCVWRCPGGGEVGVGGVWGSVCGLGSWTRCPCRPALPRHVRTHAVAGNDVPWCCALQAPSLGTAHTGLAWHAASTLVVLCITRTCALGRKGQTTATKVRHTFIATTFSHLRA